MDFLTAHAAGLRGMADPEVLTLAAGQQRLLVSHDVSTMPGHFRAFKAAGKHSAGVLLLPQSLEVGAAIDELLLIWLASEASEWENRIAWLPLCQMVALMKISARSAADARPREPARRDIGCTASPEASMDRCLASVRRNAL